MPGLGHTTGVDAGDEGEGHHALPAENLRVSKTFSDDAAVETSWARVTTAEELFATGHQPGRHPSTHDGTADLEHNVHHGVHEGVEATDCGAEAHCRVQVSAADVGRHIDPHGQGEAVHEGR